MATHSSTLAWGIPWTEEPEGYSPRGHKESDMTERLNNNSKACTDHCCCKKVTLFSQVKCLGKLVSISTPSFFSPEFPPSMGMFRKSTRSQMFSHETLIILYFVFTCYIVLVLHSQLSFQIQKPVYESTRFRSSSPLPDSKLLMPGLELNY